MDVSKILKEISVIDAEVAELLLDTTVLLLSSIKENQKSERNSIAVTITECNSLAKILTALTKLVRLSFTTVLDTKPLGIFGEFERNTEIWMRYSETRSESVMKVIQISAIESFIKSPKD